MIVSVCFLIEVHVLLKVEGVGEEKGEWNRRKCTNLPRPGNIYFAYKRSKRHISAWVNIYFVKLYNYIVISCSWR